MSVLSTSIPKILFNKMLPFFFDLYKSSEIKTNKAIQIAKIILKNKKKERKFCSFRYQDNSMKTRYYRLGGIRVRIDKRMNRIKKKTQKETDDI